MPVPLPPSFYCKFCCAKSLSNTTVATVLQFDSSACWQGYQAASSGLVGGTKIVQWWPAGRPYATHSQSTLKTSVGVWDDRSLAASVETAVWLSGSLLLLLMLAALAAGPTGVAVVGVVFCSRCRCAARLSRAAWKVFSISWMQPWRQSYKINIKVFKKIAFECHDIFQFNVIIIIYE